MIGRAASALPIRSANFHQRTPASPQDRQRLVVTPVVQHMTQHVQLPAGRPLREEVAHDDLRPVRDARLLQGGQGPVRGGGHVEQHAAPRRLTGEELRQQRAVAATDVDHRAAAVEPDVLEDLRGLQFHAASLRPVEGVVQFHVPLQVLEQADTEPSLDRVSTVADGLGEVVPDLAEVAGEQQGGRQRAAGALRVQGRAQRRHAEPVVAQVVEDLEHRQCAEQPTQ